MKKIEPLIPGDSSRTAFSAGVMNEIITALNALIEMKGIGGTRVYRSEAGYVIFSSGSMGTSTGETPITLSSGDVWL